MAKKYIRKNEIRTDLNPSHFNKYGSPHDAVITAKKDINLKPTQKRTLNLLMVLNA